MLNLQLVELKNGETYNGHLVSCDTWMNINLREVICTSKVCRCLSIAKPLPLLSPTSSFNTIFPFFFQDGDRFWRMPECYIRGSTIKYLRIPDEVIDMVKEDAQIKSRNRQEMKGNRNQQNQNRQQGGNRNQQGGGGAGGAGGGGGNNGGNRTFQQRNQGGGNRGFQQNKKPKPQ